MKIRLVKEVGEGEMLPRFYGFAWRNWYNNRAVCMPVPLNVVAGLLRAVWCFLRSGGREVWASPREAYLQGRADERRRGAAK